MKSIELTEEHKSKLLEMCKVLFPKYTFIEWNLLGKSAYDKGYLKYYTDKMKYAKFIHWFEFCMTHLAPKICDGKTYYIFCDRCNSHKKDLTEFSKEFISKYLQHPVDYLYEEFKKLKL